MTEGSGGRESQSEYAAPFMPISLPDPSDSSETPTKRKTKAKAKRTWGDAQITEQDMNALNYSVDKAADGSVGNVEDVMTLVDQSSLGSRNQDGLYEVQDWEFSKAHNDILADVIKPSDKTSSSRSLGTFGSLIARLTGSKVLTEADLGPILDGMKQHLMKKNVAKEIAEKVCEGVGESLVGRKVGGFESELSTSSLERSQLILFLGSHKHRRSKGTFNLYHSHSHSKDLD